MRTKTDRFIEQELYRIKRFPRSSWSGRRKAEVYHWLAENSPWMRELLAQDLAKSLFGDLAP